MQNDKFKLHHRHIGMAYTRTEYIKRRPQGKEVSMKWSYGDCNKAFEHELHLVATNEKLLSVNSLDAVRVTISHTLGPDAQFFMRIHPYPHVFLREHGLLGVNKAERLAKGMKKAFGKTGTRVAHVHKNQILITLKVNKNLLEQGRKALDSASRKLACGSRIDVKI